MKIICFQKRWIGRCSEVRRFAYSINVTVCRILLREKNVFDNLRTKLHFARKELTEERLLSRFLKMLPFNVQLVYYFALVEKKNQNSAYCKVSSSTADNYLSLSDLGRDGPDVKLLPSEGKTTIHVFKNT